NLSDPIFNSIKEYISSGYFKSEDDFMQAVIVEFIRKNKIELMEQFQREDIKWGLENKQGK
ncbi:MAG: hypothetical protein JXB88_14780, partial [Spirochaetales bacterium]|nr:hypothetical protein [Spirochaetales bacterium]